MGGYPTPEPDVASEVITALVTMGFTRREATAAVERGRELVGRSSSHEPLIRAALRALAPGS